MPRIITLEDTLTAEQHNDLGYIYEQKGMADLAEKEYLLAAKKKDDWQVPYFNLGNLAFQRRDYRIAEHHYRDALQRDPNNADIMNNLANALIMQARHREARILIERAMRNGSKAEYFDTLEKIREREERTPQD